MKVCYISIINFQNIYTRGGKKKKLMVYVQLLEIIC